MKKIIIFMLAVSAVFSGCKKIDDAVPADAMNADAALTVSLTQMTMPAEETAAAEISDSEIGSVSEIENYIGSDTEPSGEGVKVSEARSENEKDVPAGGDQEDVPEEILPESISLSMYSVTVQVGQSKMPIVTMLPENTSDKSEIWTSSDPDVASVDKSGNITGVSEGSCTVRVAAARNPEVYADVEVTVTSGPKLTYIDGILVVNKTYPVPSDYNPGVDPEAQAAFDKMQADAYELGLNIYISSGFRSYDYQSGLYQRYVDQSGQEAADRFSARPGHSEHQTGLAFDLNSITDAFKDTDEGKWVTENCHNYGFIIRYPADKESVTGYMYEPWHIRYLGEETAQAVYESGLCLEEYLGISSVYSE